MNSSYQKVTVISQRVFDPQNTRHMGQWLVSVACLFEPGQHWMATPQFWCVVDDFGNLYPVTRP